MTTSAALLKEISEKVFGLENSSIGDKKDLISEITNTISDNVRQA